MCKPDGEDSIHDVSEEPFRFGLSALLLGITSIAVVLAVARHSVPISLLIGAILLVVWVGYGNRPS